MNKRFSDPKNWQYAVLTGLACYITGYGAWYLTGSFSHVGILWPPAGIGLAATLLWGYGVLPGLYVSDLLLHLSSWQNAETLPQQLVFFIQPLGNVLGCWLGAVLARRFADFPNELVTLREILGFFLCSGVIASMIPGLFNALFLLVFGLLPRQELISNALSWWLGNCLGVVVFAPLFFVCFNRTHRIWRKRWLPLGLPITAFFLAILIAYWHTQSKEQERLHGLIKETASTVKAGLEREFSSHVFALNRFNAMFSSGVLNEDSFGTVASSDFTQHGDLLHLEWFKAEKTANGLQYSGQQAKSNINQTSLEFPDIQDLLNKAKIKPHPQVTHGTGQYLLIVPGDKYSEQDCDCYQSVVVGVFDYSAYLMESLQGKNFKNIVIALSGKPKENTFSTYQDKNGAEASGLQKLSIFETLELGKQHWYLQVLPNSHFWNDHYSWSPWLLLMGGMFLASFLAIGLLALTGNTEIVASQVDKRTQELKRSNTKLAARERQFRKLVQTQSAIVWRADPVTFKFIFVSAEAVSILGYPIKQWLEEPDFWQNHLHEDDKELVLKRCQQNAINAKNTSLDLEYRMIAADGKVVWLRDIATLEVEGDVVSELYGFMIDITRQKHSEEQLRLAANTFETQQGIMITDKNAKILRVNKAFSQITGYSAQQVIGENPRLLKSGRHDEAFFKNYWHHLLNPGKFEGEVWNRRKNGEVYPEWQTVTAVHNELGEISHFVSVFSDITEKKDAENKIHNMAFYDALTNLPNRRLLLDRFDQELAIAKRHNKFGAVLYLDLDHFKVLNDSQGHLVGDELLIQVAKRLSSVLREEDTPARLGGDEFVVLLHANAKSLMDAADHALVVAEKVREQLNTPFILNNYQHQIGTSIGIALFPENQEDPDAVLQQADTAMYRSKSSGRNTISFFQPSMQEAADLRLNMEQDLRMAIEQGHFILCYHPQLDGKGNLLGAEALIRWEHKEKGRLSPADFIPVAEESNLILALGKWVLMEACGQIKNWQDQGLSQVPYISINVSSRQFKQQNFIEQVKYAIENTGISPLKLGIELTESVMIMDTQDTVDKMKALKALGVTIAVDDFGTGYSSLAYLKQLPLDVLKIDRSFVRDILTDASDAVIVETIISMAKHLNIQVIAEGVENAEQLAFLKDKGCAIFQGFFFDQPLMAAKFAETYLKGNAVKAKQIG